MRLESFRYYILVIVPAMCCSAMSSTGKERQVGKNFIRLHSKVLKRNNMGEYISDQGAVLRNKRHTDSSLADFQKRTLLRSTATAFDNELRLRRSQNNVKNKHEQELWKIFVPTENPVLSRGKRSFRLRWNRHKIRHFIRKFQRRRGHKRRGRLQFRFG